MNVEINAELYFFDSKLDYLPFYRSFDLEIDGSKNIKDLLKSVQEMEPTFEYPKIKTIVQINSKLLDARIKLSEIVEVFGNRIKIEPASIYRSTNCLRFNDDDFMQKYENLSAFCSEDDLKFYRTLYATYYASETLKYNRDYFGDSLFVLAHRLIKNGSEHKKEILEIISDEKNGIGLYEYENNQYPSVDISEIIDELKQLIEENLLVNTEQMAPVKFIMDKCKNVLPGKKEKQEDPALKILSSHFNAEHEPEDALDLISKIGVETVADAVKHPFKDFNIAFYCGSRADKSTYECAGSVIKAVGGGIVDFDLSDRACGFGIKDNAPEIAYKKAGNILVDAFDNSADILVVDSDEAFEMFDQLGSKCQNAVGREIPMPIVTLAELVVLSAGIADKKELGIDDRHRVSVSFI
ncbi:MAG: hypothetical protein B5M52_00825 [Helicobacteraceae bacterium 4484_230]|nr:MAG: hypothetical protein B5M52_00825 [Helicobacteraceae bacterium 4484_230]